MLLEFHVECAIICRVTLMYINNLTLKGGEKWEFILV